MMKKLGTFFVAAIGVIYVIKYPGQSIDAGKFVVNQIVTFVEEI